MNLVLDFGNTRVKAGMFEGNKLVEQFVFDDPTSVIDAFKNADSITRCIVASVSGQHQEVYEILQNKFPVMVFSAGSPVPVSVLYKSMHTLGSDRLACAVGGYALHPDADVLTIDAGTCIKYNYVNNRNEYLGGAISPGLTMRLKAMNHYTHLLPLPKADFSFTKLTGTNTEESLLCGAFTGAACEIDEMINRYKKQYQDLVVLLTGGDADYLGKQLKNRFFASHNLVLHGLNTILDFNFEK
jgi:type III pantothenate kinase